MSDYLLNYVVLIIILSDIAPIAQLVEQLPFKEMVPGSIPGGGTT